MCDNSAQPPHPQAQSAVLRKRNRMGGGGWSLLESLDALHSWSEEMRGKRVDCAAWETRGWRVWMDLRSGMLSTLRSEMGVLIKVKAV